MSDYDDLMKLIDEKDAEIEAWKLAMLRMRLRRSDVDVSTPQAYEAEQASAETALLDRVENAERELEEAQAEIERLNDHWNAAERSFWAAADAARDRAEARVCEMQSELDECAALEDRLSEILGRVAVALKGEPRPLTSHSWHDLGEVAEKERAAREKAERERDEWRHLATSLACLTTVEWSNVASDLCDQINAKDNANRVLAAKEGR